ncbi:unnamed protein product [Thelazia callipaeda]|uniref:Macoilin n=1 Tax=Thelazia callipaeda TaxID=103827 RepID=A0A0N5CZM6_THECL|nr:unnamed protein product [Thelazia callipaeda]
MMKRTGRTFDLPKIRRNMKGRGRISETMCCGHFSGVAYVKLVLLWLGCIALDLLIGFRFELLYPVWLLMRRCYESFRFHGLISTLHYSTYSVFFVCATVTTDLICFIFLPFQLLFFLASTYVWILLVWQTADRGIGSTQFLLWFTLIAFEYNWRYRGDSPLQILKGSSLASTLNFLTGGLLANSLGLQDVSIGGEIVESDLSKDCSTSARFSNSASGILDSLGVALMTAFTHSSSLSSDFCRPFAAHCIGYPVVTLGFGLKTYIKLWRVKRRRLEVSRANEVYCKLLTEALPMLYDDPKLYARSSDTITHDQIEYEADVSLSGTQNLAICGSSSPLTQTHRKNSRAGMVSKQNSKHSGTCSKKNTVSGGSAPARKGKVVQGSNCDDDSSSSVSLLVTSRMYLWRIVWEVIYGIVLHIFGIIFESPSLVVDDRVSLSSNEVGSDDEVIELEETSSQPDDTSPYSNRLSSRQRPTTSSKKSKMLIPSSRSFSQAKGGRSRGRHLQNHTDCVLSPLTSSSALTSTSLGANCAFNNNLLNLAAGSVQQDRHMYSSTSNTALQSSGSAGNEVVENSVPSGMSASANNGKTSEHYISETLETMRSELRAARSQETELRSIIQQYVIEERQLKGELQQLKLKQEQSDNKLASLMKAREQDKSAIQQLEKKLIDAQTKRNEVEKELNAERRKAKEEHDAARLAAAQFVKNFECGEMCKARRADMEKDLRIVRRELKIKEELINSHEEELRQLRYFKENNDIKELHATLRAIREKNIHLEKSLSAENRLKQELFRALSEARGQMAEFQQQLRLKDADLRSKQAELMNLRERIGGETDNAAKLCSVGDNRPSLSVKSPRCVSSGSSMSPSIVTDINSVMKSSVTAEQQIFNTVFRPYTFNTQTSEEEHSLFDNPIARSPPAPSCPVSRPSSSRLSSVSSDSFHFAGNRFSLKSGNTDPSRP